MGNIPAIKQSQKGDPDFTHDEHLILSWKNLQRFPESLLNRSDVGTIDSLVLDFNNIPVLPPTISNFTSLTELSLVANKLTYLPNTLFTLSSLVTLNLSANQLTNIPPQIGTLMHLETLLLQNNHLADLPFTIAQLLKLKDLDCSQNSKICIPLLPASLTSLDLATNQMTSFPKFLCRSTNLTQLNLSENHISALPGKFKNLSNLRILLLPCCEITEIKDKTMTPLTQLQTIDISFNQLSVLPSPWLNHPTIQSLDMCGNPFPKEYIQQFDDHRYISYTDPKPDEILPHLFLGSWEAAKNKEYLKMIGVTHILVTCYLPELYPHLFKYHVAKIHDRDSEDLYSHFESCGQFIESGRKAGAVLVHLFSQKKTPFLTRDLGT